MSKPTEEQLERDRTKALAAEIRERRQGWLTRQADFVHKEAEETFATAKEYWLFKKAAKRLRRKGLTEEQAERWLETGSRA